MAMRPKVIGTSEIMRVPRVRDDRPRRKPTVRELERDDRRDLTLFEAIGAGTLGALLLYVMMWLSCWP